MSTVYALVNLRLAPRSQFFFSILGSSWWIKMVGAPRFSVGAPLAVWKILDPALHTILPSYEKIPQKPSVNSIVSSNKPQINPDFDFYICDILQSLSIGIKGHDNTKQSLWMKQFTVHFTQNRFSLFMCCFHYILLVSQRIGPCAISLKAHYLWTDGQPQKHA